MRHFVCWDRTNCCAVATNDAARLSLVNAAHGNLAIMVTACWKSWFLALDILVPLYQDSLPVRPRLLGENCFPISIRSRRVKFTIVASLIVIIGLAVGVYAYSQIQQQEIIRFLTRYHAYSPDFKYQPLDVMDVDSLPKSGGNITVQNLIIDYAFNQPDEYDNVP